MENQNAYAPSADPLGEDVLEIPRPLRSTQHAGEQTLVLEDIIAVPAAHELSPWEEGIDPQDMDASRSDTFLSDEDDERTLVLPSLSALGPERNRLPGTDLYIAAPAATEASAPDYEGYRAWVRIAPLLLLLGALAFFSLYYLGNKMGESGRDTAENAATSTAPQPETTVATTATSPQSTESAPPVAAQPATPQPTESSVVGASAETQKPEEKSKVEVVKTEAPPAAAPVASSAPAAAAPPVSAAPSASESPATEQSVGNFTVQVGSYNDAAQAEERAGRLRSSGIEARVVRADIPRRGTWYRVQAGRFSSQQEATRFASEIKGKGATDDFIITSAQ
ncbi:MAG TPA: SPOR domain-containing protein [Pyrinomonadaceae bacterium]|nr:SPOR domain-containing protein [Pyrinomonadaceae bacterium]